MATLCVLKIVNKFIWNLSLSICRLAVLHHIGWVLTEEVWRCPVLCLSESDTKSDSK